MRDNKSNWTAQQAQGPVGGRSESPSHVGPTPRPQDGGKAGVPTAAKREALPQSEDVAQGGPQAMATQIDRTGLNPVGGREDEPEQVPSNRQVEFRLKIPRELESRLNDMQHRSGLPRSAFFQAAVLKGACELIRETAVGA